MKHYASYSDCELADLLIGGDELAYIAVYDRYWKRLFIHACQMLRDEDQAMDVVQDIFTILWNRRKSIVIKTSIKTYLYTSVRNHVLNTISKSKLRTKYLDSIVSFIEQGETSTESQVICKDFMDRIDRQVGKFSPRMRTIYTLSREEGLSNKDIARELNITDHTVKKTISRALKVLRAQISTVFF